MEPKTIEIHKAQGNRGEEIQTLIISASIVAEKNRCCSLKVMGREWEKEGEALSNALFDHLPGGLIDGLLAAMMKRRASLFVVKF